MRSLGSRFFTDVVAGMTTMLLGRATVCAVCLAATWPLAGRADDLGPQLLAAAPTHEPATNPSGPPAVPVLPGERRLQVAEPHQIVRFAGRTIEFAVPPEWTVKQVPLPGEIRVLAGPGDLPDDPLQLERGLWIAYHRIEAEASAASLEAELRNRLPRAAGRVFRAAGGPQPLRVGAFAGLMQMVQVAPGDLDGLPRRASYILVRTTWGLLEAWAATTVGSTDEVQPGLQMALTSLRLNPPTALAPVSANGIADAQSALGSWKGRQIAMHFLPEGRVRLDFDAVQILAPSRDDQSSTVGVGRHIEGSFAAQDDVIFITWDDGSQLNYRWTMHEGELLLMDHTGNSSRLKRLFYSPPPSPGEAGSLGFTP
jgi:hypothetical protein